MKASVISAVLAVLPCTLASPTWNHGYPYGHGNGDSKGKYPGLGVLAKRAGLKYFGTAIDNVVLDNGTYISIAHNKSEFNQVTPANGQKWMYIEPQRNVFNFTAGDQVIVPARNAGQMTRCHNFVWHNQLADWVTAQNWTAAELTQIMENHIKNEARHYPDCYAWDVVNEAFEEDGSYRDSIWLRTLGKGYIELAFKFARKYTHPKTRLYYNDYNIETVNNKSLAVASLVKDFNRRGVPIDGVGLQSHFTVGRSPTYDQIRAALTLFEDLDMETALTELDVRTTVPSNATQVAEQAQVYSDSVKACVDSNDCVGVTVWDFWDPVSWVPDTFPGYGEACLWDANFNKKPAYYAISDMLREYD